MSYDSKPRQKAAFRIGYKFAQAISGATKKKKLEEENRNRIAEVNDIINFIQENINLHIGMNGDTTPWLWKTCITEAAKKFNIGERRIRRILKKNNIYKGE
jgi:hypothetical protein